MMDTMLLSPALELTAIRAWLIARHHWLAVAESMTAGRVQSLCASMSGASDYFLGGITTYNLTQKVRQLGVDRRAAEQCNCVSERTAVEMADGVQRLFRSDWALATTGYAEPDETRSIEIPFAWVAIVGPAQRRMAQRIEASGTRCEVQQIIALAAVRMLNSTILTG